MAINVQKELKYGSVEAENVEISSNSRVILEVPIPDGQYVLSISSVWMRNSDDNGGGVSYCVPYNVRLTSPTSNITVQIRNTNSSSNAIIDANVYYLYYDI